MPAPDDTARGSTPSPTKGTTARPGTRLMLLIAALTLIAVAAVGTFLADPDRGADPGSAGSTDEPADVGEAGSGAGAALEPEESAPSTLHADSFADRAPEDPRALGEPDAPVVMIEWADFECGFCARFARETEPELIERYVETGILRIEWRDLPLQGDAAWNTALAGRAAADQDAFWDLHEALYAEDSPLPAEQRDRDGLAGLAEELDLDVDAFLRVYDDPDTAADVAAEAQAAQQLGINGTPAFLIADQPVMGAQPLELFVDLIETAAEDEGIDLP